MKRKKIYVAMVTPFTKGNLIDDEAVGRLCTWFLEQHVDGIVVCGTTGEVSSLSFEERAHLLKLVKKNVGSKAEIWMGCGTNNTSSTCLYAMQAQEIGVDGIMVITPYYVRPSQSGLFAHYDAVASCVSVPIMLYNVSKRTGVSLQAKTIISLAKRHSHIKALKQADFCPDDILKVMSETGLEVYCGDDFWLDQALKMNMDGIVSVAAHIDVKSIRKMMDGHALSIYPEQLISKWKDLSRHCFLVSSPSDVKYMLKKRKLCEDVVRLPLVSLNEEEKQRVDQMMKKYSYDSNQMF